MPRMRLVVDTLIACILGIHRPAMHMGHRQQEQWQINRQQHPGYKTSYPCVSFHGCKGTTIFRCQQTIFVKKQNDNPLFTLLTPHLHQVSKNDYLCTEISKIHSVMMQLVNSNGTVLLERKKPSTKRANNSTLHVRRMSQGMKNT